MEVNKYEETGQAIFGYNYCVDFTDDKDYGILKVGDQIEILD